MPPSESPSPAFLSVRLPTPTRDRLKAAAPRAISVQTLVGGLVERFLAEEGQGLPSLAAVLASLRVELSDLLGASADLVERETLSLAMRTAAERDAVRVA